MPKISVVIPIYNAEPFLNQCLQSIADQTEKDIEILCVNDGSTDGSLDTIQSFAERDDRFVVLDKPNGGYGHSLNYGIARACGLYLSIIEPDDFIDPHMYEELMAFSHYGGEIADIVKGSYWEFYDGRDGVENAALEPNLSRFMKKTPFAFKLADDAEVFSHHPSIWSAIYRMDFLRENNIQFVEPKGAGWADNPFLAETLVRADRIVWVPKAYYYYRQTNPNASSFLKDYHVPFDRAREMRAFLHEQNVSDDTWAAFYLREFFYIASIVGEFGFEESDPEVRSLIYEVLEDMDPKIVCTNTHLTAENIVYYTRMMNMAKSESGSRLNDEAYGDGIVAPANYAAKYEEETPLITFIVPIGNDAEWIDESLESLRTSTVDSFEVICVDMGSRDRSMALCQTLAERDLRFSIVGGTTTAPVDNLNVALDLARGYYLYLYSPDTRFNGSAFFKILACAMEMDVDAMVMDTRCRFSAHLLLKQGSRINPYEIIGDKDHTGLVTHPFAPAVGASYVLNASYPNLYSLIYSMRLIRGSGVRFESGDEHGEGSFAARALLHASRISYASSVFLRDLYDLVSVVPFHLDMRDWHVQERPTVIQTALAAAGNPEVFSAFKQSVLNLLLESFMYDLSHRRTLETIKRYHDEYLPVVARFLDPEEGTHWFHDGGLHAEYQVLRHRGLQAYLGMRYLVRERDASWLQNVVEDIEESRSYQLGRSISAIVSTILPDRALGRLRSLIANKR